MSEVPAGRARASRTAVQGGKHLNQCRKGPSPRQTGLPRKGYSGRSERPVTGELEESLVEGTWSGPLEPGFPLGALVPLVLRAFPRSRWGPELVPLRRRNVPAGQRPGGWRVSPLMVQRRQGPRELQAGHQPRPSCHQLSVPSVPSPAPSALRAVLRPKRFLLPSTLPRKNRLTLTLFIRWGEKSASDTIS